MVTATVNYSELQKMNRAIKSLKKIDDNKYNIVMDTDDKIFMKLEISYKADDETYLFDLIYYPDPENVEEDNDGDNYFVVENFDHEDEKEMLELLDDMGVKHVGVNVNHDKCDRDWPDSDGSPYF